MTTINIHGVKHVAKTTTTSATESGPYRRTVLQVLTLAGLTEIVLFSTGHDPLEFEELSDEPLGLSVGKETH